MSRRRPVDPPWLAKAKAEGRILSDRGVGGTIAPPPMTIDPQSEAEFTALVLRFARSAGWLAYHTHDSRRSEPGFPDVFAARHPDVVAAELKMPGNEPTEAQGQWLKVLKSCGVKTFLWYPEDWPEITEVLR